MVRSGEGGAVICPNILIEMAVLSPTSLFTGLSSQAEGENH